MSLEQAKRELKSAEAALWHYDEDRGNLGSIRNILVSEVIKYQNLVRKLKA